MPYTITPYNRTIMELKLLEPEKLGRLLNAYNRTIMELKFF